VVAILDASREPVSRTIFMKSSKVAMPILIPIVFAGAAGGQSGKSSRSGVVHTLKNKISPEIIY